MRGRSIILGCYIIMCENYHGYGVPISNREAVRWWRKAAEQGEPNAQYLLGYEYIVQGGDEVTREDTLEALGWWRKAAAQGVKGAQFYLGVFYHDGNGVPKDYRAALEWFSKGAEQGDARSQNGLGAMYFNGEGTRKDYIEAYKWFNLAAAKGNQDALENRAMAEDFMRKDDIARAQSRAREWASKH